MSPARMCVVLAVALALPTSAATSQTVTGDIQGAIVDGSGKALPGVTVTIANTATGFARETITADDGAFAAPGLPVGPYEVQASLQGFATRRQTDVSVQVGRVLTLRLELTVAPAPETITVAGTAPTLETTRSHVSSTVNSMDVLNLPVADRNALALTLLAPGVTGSALTGDVSVAGQGAFMNRVTVDGADRGRPFGGADRISLEATQELQVNTSAYPAEYGRAGGGVVNLVTKSGSNELGGSAVQYFGDTQFGAWAGAPIVRNRHFIFGIYDAQRFTKPNSVFLNLPANTPSDAATRAAIDRLRPRAVSWDRTQDSDLLLVKTDHQFSDSQRLTLRYNREDFQGRGLDRATNVAAEAAGAIDASSHAFTATAASILGSSLFNEARVHLSRDRETGEPDADAPFATIGQSGAEVLRIGQSVFSSRDARVTRVQFADTLTWVRGAHKLKAGLDAQFDNIVSRVPGSFAGSYTFQSLASFGRGVPNGSGDAYVQAFEGPGTSGRTTHPDVAEYSLFAQDEWHVNEALTVNLGVRYDAQTFAQPESGNPDPQLAAAGIDTSTIASDRNNIGPRLGVAWAPVGKRLVVRGGYGLVYGRTPWTMAAAAHANNGINVQTIALRGASGDRVPVFPNRLLSMPAGLASRSAIIAFNPDYQNARVQQASGGVEWEWMPHTAVSATYLLLRGDRLPRAVDLNTGGGPFTNVARVISYESAAQSRYHGVTIEMTRRFAQGHQYRVAYTLGRVEDTMPAVTALVPETSDDRTIAPSGDSRLTAFAPGDNNRRHRLVGAVIYSTNRFGDRFDGFMRTLFSDWMLSAVYTAQSGRPYSAYVSGDRGVAFNAAFNGDNNRFNDLAPGTTRNQFRLPGSISVDPRIAREIELKGDARVTLIWEAFNLLNHGNHDRVHDTLYEVVGTELRANPLFGEVLDQGQPRTMLAAVRFSF